MFVGREHELDSLNKSFNEQAFQFSVIFGRRRVGKTTLISEFCKDKKSVYFVAVQSTAKENLAILSEQIIKALAPDAPLNSFSSFREAFEYVFERSMTERFIFAIDEYPYLAKSDPSISSLLQAAIDKCQASSKLFLILCGSSMSFMEKQVLGYESPLYGRRTSQYKMLPFDYYESAKLLSGYSSEDKIVFYSILGGMPEYLSRVQNGLTIEENARSLFFDPSGRLFEEPENLLKQELKMPETYSAIISSIASGNTRINEISTKVGIETSQCSNMISTLIALGLIRKEQPAAETNSKKSIYLLNDWMLVFWYRFVKPDLGRIQMGLGKTVCNEVFSEHIFSHTGKAFEECAQKYMWRLLKEDKSPLFFKSIGRWWGNNAKLRREEEIDLVAYSGKEAIFGECKWQSSQLGIETLAELVRRSELLPNFTDKKYILFSKSGFNQALRSKSEKDADITLVSPKQMFL